MNEKEKKEEIRIEDRRHFDKEGNIVTPETQSVAEESEEKIRVSGDRDTGPASSKIGFVAILFSYVHTALVHLGDLEDPIQKTTSQDLNGARQMIDILELLQEKTKGNLDSREEDYLTGALFDLRMRYMQKAKIIK